MWVVVKRGLRCAGPTQYHELLMQLRDFLHRTSTAPDVASVLEALAGGAAELADLLASAEVHSHNLGNHGLANATGDTQQKIDVIADDKFLELLRELPCVAWIGSEEQEQLVPAHAGANLFVTYDPLDGSSNLNAHIPTGTIFGIWRATADLPKQMPSGAQLLAAGYVMYSRAVVLVASTGQEPFVASLDPGSRQWMVTREKIHVPDKLACYSVNEANREAMDSVTQTTIRSFHGRTSLRYVGSMVADIHRNLLYGGLFSYPADKKNPAGKLRYFYECAPLGWLYEKAGGRAFDGRQRLLDAQHNELHARSPIYLGSQSVVLAIEDAYKTAPQS